MWGLMPQSGFCLGPKKTCSLVAPTKVFELLILARIPTSQRKPIENQSLKRTPVCYDGLLKIK